MWLVFMMLLVVLVLYMIVTGEARKEPRKTEPEILPIQFGWRDPPIADLREKLICRQGKILWRGQGQEAQIDLSIGRHELDFVWISYGCDWAKQRVQFWVFPDGRTQAYPGEWEFYPRKKVDAS